MERIKVLLPPTEYTALVELAERELRPIPNQVRVIVREALIRRGLLQSEEPRQAQVGEAAKALREEGEGRVDRWRKWPEERPPEDTFYICCLKEIAELGARIVAELMFEAGEWQWDPPRLCGDEWRVAHWRPFPEPPGGEGQ